MINSSELSRAFPCKSLISGPVNVLWVLTVSYRGGKELDLRLYRRGAAPRHGARGKLPQRRLLRQDRALLRARPGSTRQDLRRYAGAVEELRPALQAHGEHQLLPAGSHTRRLTRGQKSSN